MRHGLKHETGIDFVVCDRLKEVADEEADDRKSAKPRHESRLHIAEPPGHEEPFAKGSSADIEDMMIAADLQILAIRREDATLGNLHPITAEFLDLMRGQQSFDFSIELIR